jgi:hypothetical protein
VCLDKQLRGKQPGVLERKSLFFALIPELEFEVFSLKNKLHTGAHSHGILLPSKGSGFIHYLKIVVFARLQ